MYTKGKWTLKDGANNLYRQTIENDPGCFEAYCQCHYTIYGSKPHQSQFIADIIVESSDEGLANAQRICQCVNSHDALVAALKYAQDFIAGKISNAKPDVPVAIKILTETIKEAKEVLKQAESEM